MSRHIDIELTSRAPDGTWTWRASGARQPRGALEPAAVPDGASVGTTYRAEIESSVDGIEIVALLPPRPPRSPSAVPGRIEFLGAPRRTGDISVTLAPGSRRRRDEGDRPRPRGGPGRGGGREGGPPGRREHQAEEGSGPVRGGTRHETRSPRERPATRPGVGRREHDHRTLVSTAYRNATLAGLRSEQLPIAEAILRGGMPAVRRSIDEQNAATRASGKPPASADAIIAMAEELLPVVKLAEWKDRAASAQSAGRELRLRELRAVVAASRTVTLDDEGRALARVLHESLDTRVAALREEWVGRITKALDAGRTLEALQATGRAPEPGTRLSADLATRLASDAGQAMTAELAAEDWLAFLDAVVDSPVRRNVKPGGIPPVEEVAAAARNAAGLVPELAKLLGLRIPPPPPRRTVVRRSVSSGSGGGRAAGS